MRVRPRTRRIREAPSSRCKVFRLPPSNLDRDLAGAYSRRINIQHRLVYQVLPEIRTVKVLRMWTLYE